MSPCKLWRPKREQEIVMEVREVARWKTFSENIGELVSRGDEFDDNIAANHFLSDKMVINLDVFGVGVKY